MWHQRIFGLEYVAKHLDSDFIFAVDDDISFLPDLVANSIRWMENNHCDVLAPDLDSICLSSGILKSIFSFKNLIYSLLGLRVENPFQKERVKIMGTSGFMANTNVCSDAVPTQSAQFAAFFIRTDKVKLLDLKSEYWLEGTKYALPDDQVFYYKCYLFGLKIYMHEKYTINHLDHGSSNPDRISDISYANGRNFFIFWHRFLFSRAGLIKKLWLIVCIMYRIIMLFIFYLIKSVLQMNFKLLNSYCSGVFAGIAYVLSPEYKRLPIVYKLKP